MEALEGREVPAVLAQWGFNSLTPDSNPTTGMTDPTIGTGTMSAVGLNAAAFGYTTQFIDAAQSGWTANTDPNAADNSVLTLYGFPEQGTANRTAGVAFAVDTTGYTNVGFSFDIGHGWAAANRQVIQYSTDGGTTWADAATVAQVNGGSGVEVAVSGVAAGVSTSLNTTAGSYWLNFGATLPGVSNNAGFQFRVVAAFDGAGYVSSWEPSAANYEAGQGGTWHIDMVTITGDVPPPPPVVSLTAAPGNATEGGDPGAFRLTRTGNLSQPLTVGFAIDPASTASAASDYTLAGSGVTFDPLTLTGSVTFAASQDTLDITVGAVDDATTEDTETVTLSLTASSLYDFGAFSAASVNVIDNDPPPPVVIGVTDSYSVKANTSDLLNGASGAVLDNDYEENDDPLTASLVSGPAHGTLALEADGTFTYTPNAGFVGDDSFVYRPVSGTTLGTETTVSLFVYNAAPTASDAETTTHAGTAAEGDVSGRASDADDFTGLTFSLATGTGFDPQYGTVTLAADGSFSYTPNAGFAGTDSFYYRVSDGVSTSEPCKVTVFVDNAAPLGSLDTFYVWPVEGSVATGSGNVLDNDYDADGDTLHAILVDGPTYAEPDMFTLTSTGAFTYQLASNLPSTFPGYDTFTYAVTDGFATSAPVTVTLRAASGPVGTEDWFFTSGTDPLTVSAAQGVLSNDLAAVGASMTALLVQGPNPSVGVVVLNANGSFTFTPGPNFVDTAEFVYTHAENQPQQQGNQPDILAHILKGFGDALNDLALRASVSLAQMAFVVHSRPIERDVLADGQMVAYRGPNWLDRNANGVVTDAGDQRTPIMVTRGDRIALRDIQFLVSGQSAGMWAAADKNRSINIRASQPGENGITFGFDAVVTGRYVEFNDANGVRVRRIVVDRAVADNTLPNRAGYDQNFTLNWELSTDGGCTWITPIVGTSQTTMYVTYATTLGGVGLESVPEALLSISLKGLPSQDFNEQQFVDAVFHKFEMVLPAQPNATPIVRRTDNTVLSYYGQWATNEADWRYLIANGDGTCVAWAKMFKTMLAANGITATIRNPQSKNKGEDLVVKDWTFSDKNLPVNTGILVQEMQRYEQKKDAQGNLKPDYTKIAVVGDDAGYVDNLHPGGGNVPAPRRKVVYTHFNIPVAGDTLYAGPPAGVLATSRAANKFKWGVIAAVNDVDGVPGQNTVNPPSIFISHVIVAYGNRIYDPSYGVSYANMLAFENAAIVGFVTEQKLMEGPMRGQVNADLDGDGEITPKKEVVVFLFRTNSNQEQDLI